MTASSPPPAPAERAPSRATPLALFVLFELVILLGGALAYASGAANLRRRAEQELATVAAFKVREVERWRDERLADAGAIAADPTLRRLAGDPRSGGSAASLSTEVEQWFDALRGIGEYSAIALLDAEGAALFGLGDAERGARGPAVLALARRAAAERRPLIGGLHAAGEGDVADFVLVAPIFHANGPARHTVLLRVDPRRYLFSMLQSWPSPSPSAETLLVRPSGDRVFVVNALRHGTGEPAGPSIPIGRRDGLLAFAGSGGSGLVEGEDYRGVRVLAAVEPVPATPWILVAKVDAAEAFAPIRSLGLRVLLLVLAAVATSSAGVLLWWRVQVSAFERSRTAAEAERGALARRLERLTRHALDMVLLSDENYRVVDANERAMSSLGYTREELVGKSLRDLRDPATVSDFDARVREQRDKGAAVFETRYRRKDGSIFPVEVSAHSEVYEGRRWFQGIVRDISARKAAEEAVRESEARFRAVFEESSLGMSLLDAKGLFVGVNRAFRELLGFTEEEVARMGVSDLREESGGVTPFEVFARLRDGEVDSMEVPRRYRRTDGRLVDVILRATAVRDDRGALRFVLGLFEDVTERRRMEAQLLLADRMVSVGTLAAGVAHEINNPLSFVLSNVDFALAQLRGEEADPEIRQALEDAKHGAVRVRAIVRDMKTFSRAEGEVRAPLDVRSVLLSAIGLASNEIRHRAELSVDPGDVPLVLASEHQLGQALLNLLINAAQAIPEGNAHGNLVRAATSTSPDGRAVVEISDTGSGIPPELRSRIFDPFFTTKPVGVGTGLGLSICHAIVTHHGGEISVEDGPSGGTIFRITLPPCVEPPDPGVPVPAPPGPAGRRGRILVVDDEELVGRAVARTLSQVHDVVVRTSGRDALELLAPGGAGFDALVCDLMMPGMTGMELHGRVREIDPSLAGRIVFLTGGAFTPEARAFLDAVQNPRLDKPFEPVVLRALVAGVLGEEGPPT